MFEARIIQGSLIKKVIEAIKDLVTEANFDCNETCIQLQAMDQSHVALVSLVLKAEGFDPFRCDRNLALGISLTGLGKLLKCSANDDIITLKANDSCESLTLIFENEKDQRVSEYDMKLMNIDSDHLTLPDTQYNSIVEISSTEFQRICRDLSVLSETISKEGVSFCAVGDLANGTIKLSPNSSIDECNEPVKLAFALKYLSNFTKATPLSNTVKLSLSEDIPLLVEYKIADIGHLQYYLAPKVDG